MDKEEADRLLQLAAPLLEEVGENGYPDYGASVTFEDGKPVVHHTATWKPKSNG